MMFDQLVESILNESNSYYGKKISFKDPDTGKFYKEGTIVDPDVVEEIETEECHGPHITDEWHGANEHTIGRNFDEENPAWYIVATGSWETCPTQGDFHIVSAKEVRVKLLVKDQGLSDDVANTIINI
jgi:hypothetical protein